MLKTGSPFKKVPPVKAKSNHLKPLETVAGQSRKEASEPVVLKDARIRAKKNAGTETGRNLTAPLENKRGQIEPDVALPSPGQNKLIEFIKDFYYNGIVPSREEMLAKAIRDIYNINAAEADGLSVIVHDHYSKYLKKSEQELPENYPLYKDREKDPVTNKKKTAIEFYNDFWKRYADAGILHRDELFQRDSALVEGIRSQCQREKKVAKEFLPPAKFNRTNPIEALNKHREAMRNRYHQKINS